MWVVRCIVLAACCASAAVFAIEDECKKHTFNVTGNHMQFVKEITNAEYAINGMFKGLHCCAKGYRSIEWLKDGQPYPWHSSSSGLILYPESANQTIYTQRVTPEDAGNYTCIVRNDSHWHEHSITLKVYDKAPDQPQLTYVSKDQEVSVGHSLRLYCEAFVGALDHLPDAYNDAYWAKILPNGTMVRESKHFNLEKISREDNQTSGAYLTIDKVTMEDFGTYICTIKKPGKDINEIVHVRKRETVEYLIPNPMPWKQLLFVSVGILLLCLTIFMLNKKFGLLLRVKFKDRFGSMDRNDGKSTDVLVAYASDDSGFALETLLPTLERKFNYAAAARQLPTNVNLWASQLMEASKKCRRLIAVLSPKAVQGNWDTATLYEALKQLNSLQSQFTCVLMEDPPRNSNETKNEQGETFASLFRQVVHVRWHGAANADRFWLALRLHLPPKQFYSDVQSIDMTQTNVKRLNEQRVDIEEGLV